MSHPPILFEDAEALVIDKPGGLPIETPRKGGPSLEDHLEALKLGFHYPPMPVHRIDTDTSGCLLLARNARALKRFAKAFEDRVVGKRYLGVLAGVPAQSEGTVSLALSKISSADAGWRMIPARKGKPSVTHWRVLAESGGRALVEFRPETGRTHQIRVHAASGIGLPLLGDPVYGAGAGAGQGTGKGPGNGVRRTLLHAAALEVPRAGKPPILAAAPMPGDFRALGFDDG